MKPKLIKNAKELEEALERIDALMDTDPSQESDEGRELELLAMLVEKYEATAFPIAKPSPLEAIRFRMEQAGLKQSDLAPYFGGKAKVSEVLNGKRPLSLKMVRALHLNLGIPAEILLQEHTADSVEAKYNLKDFPFTQMVKRGYFESFHGSLPEARETGEELLDSLFGCFKNNQPKPVLCRKSEGKELDTNALYSWQARVSNLAKRELLPNFKRESVNKDFARSLAKISYLDEGPRVAIEFLNKKGIHVILARHLEKTYLDGGCFLSSNAAPVIGLTLRHDRTDNFWFTLLHELGHLTLHYEDMREKGEAFFDDTDRLKDSRSKREREANDFARDALIPDETWAKHKAHLLKNSTESEIKDFAESLSIHPAIVAGRIQWEKKDYQIAPNLLGRNTLRKQLPVEK